MPIVCHIAHDPRRVAAQLRDRFIDAGAGRDHDIGAGGHQFVGNGKAIAQGEPEGLVKTVFDAKTGELLGASSRTMRANSCTAKTRFSPKSP